MLQPLLISAAGLGLSSLLGSAVGMTVRRIPHRWNDIFLGFCAGMMLAAALVCLIMPAVDAAGLSSCWQPLLGVALGVSLVWALDYVVPHLHHIAGIDSEHHPAHGASVNRVLLFVIAIAIHKFPEGLATGVAFDSANTANAYAVVITIALQNIPEGLVVVTPLIMIGVGWLRVVAVSLAVACLEVAGLFAGYFIADLSSAMLPLLTALAGGAMLYVISDEIIPETHSHGFEKPATFALIAGVMAMLFIRMLL